MKIRSLAFGAALIVSQAAAAGEAGQHAAAASNLQEKLAACAVCHGPNGVSTQPTFPTLAGQHRDYLARALHDYKSGARKSPVMSPQAATLSEADIKALAEFFSKQQGPLYTPALK
ncbi:MAG: c-type cytochrome [Nevskiales bacterium]